MRSGHFRVGDPHPRLLVRLVVPVFPGPPPLRHTFLSGVPPLDPGSVFGGGVDSRACVLTLVEPGRQGPVDGVGCETSSPLDRDGA